MKFLEDEATSPTSGHKDSIMKVTFSPRDEMETSKQTDNFSRFRDSNKPIVPLKSYLTNDINIKSMLKKYRKSMEKKYPDPQPKDADLSIKES